MPTETIYISSGDDLKAAYIALAQGQGGEIVLAPNEDGEKYSLQVYDRSDPAKAGEDKPVLIRSADPDNPAVFRYMSLRGVENATIDGVAFEGHIDTIPIGKNMVALTRVQNVEIRNSVFTSVAEGPRGTVDDFDQAAGLMRILSSDGVRFADNTVSNISGGIRIDNSYNTEITGNDISRIQGDGIMIGGATGLLIEGNHMHDFYGSPHSFSHSDFIQLWGSHINVNNQDITIRSNILDTGSGGSYQMIFGRNEHKAQNGFVYTGIVVEDNVVRGSSAHMISIADTDGMVIRNNTVLFNDGAHQVVEDGSAPEVAGVGFVSDLSGTTLIEGNIVHNIRDPDGPGDNIELSWQCSSKEDDYRNHFINADSGGSADLRDLQLMPDSPWNGVYGSSLTWYQDTTEQLTALARTERSSSDPSLITFNAGLSTGPDGMVDPETTKAVWTFEDGTTLEGLQITRSFAEAGWQTYTLRITNSAGETDEITRDVRVHDKQAIVLTAEDAETTCTTTSGDNLAFRMEDGVTVEDGWFSVGTGARVIIERSNSQIFNLDSFNYGMTLNPDAGATGVFLSQRRALVAQVTDTGAVVFELQTSDGSFTVSSDAGLFDNGAPRHLNFVYDSSMGMLALYVDGQNIAQTDACGVTEGYSSTDLAIGNWAHASLSAKVSNISFTPFSGVDPDTQVFETYCVTMGIPLPTDEIPDANDMFAIPDDALVFFDFDGHASDTSGNAAQVNADDDITFTEGRDGGQAFVLDKTSEVSISRGEDFLFGRDAFGFSLDLRTDDDGAFGDVFRLYNSVRLTAKGGDLEFVFNNDDGDRFSVASTGSMLDGGDWHRVEIGYDSATQSLWMSIDGTRVDEAEATGLSSTANYWGMTFGGKRSVIGAIDNFAMTDGSATIEPEMTASAIPDDALVFFDFDGHASDTSGNAAQVNADDDITFTEGRDGGQAFVLDKTSEVSISRGEDFLFGRDAFGFSLDLRTDDDGAFGDVFRLYNSVRLTAKGGDLEFVFNNDDGDRFSVASTGSMLDGGDWHRVEIGYDSATQSLWMSIDGTRVDEAEATGLSSTANYWGMTFGGKRSVIGAIDNFAMTDGSATIEPEMTASAVLDDETADMAFVAVEAGGLVIDDDAALSAGADAVNWSEDAPDSEAYEQEAASVTVDADTLLPDDEDTDIEATLLHQNSIA